ncbi:MAG: DUF4292 domain-containing protein [Prevotella sp.]|nr:DUF4292 domain-containing protein [Prevotella sp.]
MKKSSLLKVAILALPLMLASCKSKKNVVEESKPVVVVDSEQSKFLNKVQNNAQTAKFITSKVKFSVEVGVQNITLTGNLKMKRDDVIRLQLMAFGFVEAARIEFTKDYVLIMDRINKQYLKAPYISIDFLRNSGLNFYSLQALFWNELFQPNRQTISQEDFQKFNANLDNDDVVITLEDNKLDYSWLVNQNTGIIKMANILYKDRFNGNAQLNWDYVDFTTLEATNKRFPNDMNVTLTTPKKEVKLGIKLNYITNETEWETRTEVSNKYREVPIDEILQRFMAL